MARKKLESSALSVFCGSMATMISAGIQLDEATLMLSENRARSRFQEVCAQLYNYVSSGDSLSAAMKKTGAFPLYAVDMVFAGEKAGHLEPVLRNLELYYDEEDRLFTKLRSSVGYPAALLCIMSVILAFTVVVVLPVFTSVYENMAGSLGSGSFSSVSVSGYIGWVALVVMAVLALISVVLVLMTNSSGGRSVVMGLLAKLPHTQHAMYQLELSRFTASLATLVSSGLNEEDCVERAADTVGQSRLRRKLAAVHADITNVDNPLSLTQAIAANNVYEPLYSRMLVVGMRSGSADQTLTKLSSTFFDDAVLQLDRFFDNIEPVMAALLTITVGATLIAVMLPLVGIMASIG